MRFGTVFLDPVTYDIDGKCYVLLVDKYMYLEIQVRHHAEENVDEFVYYEIKRKVEIKLGVVCKKLKVHYSHICVGFRCSKCSDFHLTRNKYCNKQKKHLTFYCQNNEPHKF